MFLPIFFFFFFVKIIVTNIMPKSYNFFRNKFTLLFFTQKSELRIKRKHYTTK